MTSLAISIVSFNYQISVIPTQEIFLQRLDCIDSGSLRDFYQLDNIGYNLRYFVSVIRSSETNLSVFYQLDHLSANRSVSSIVVVQIAASVRSSWCQ